MLSLKNLDQDAQNDKHRGNWKMENVWKLEMEIGKWKMFGRWKWKLENGKCQSITQDSWIYN